MDGFKKCTSRPAPSVCRFLQQNRHKTDVDPSIIHVCCRGQNGHAITRAKVTGHHSSHHCWNAGVCPNAMYSSFLTGDAFGFVSAASTILHHSWLGTEGNEDGGGTSGAFAMSTGAALDSS